MKHQRRTRKRPATAKATAKAPAVGATKPKLPSLSIIYKDVGDDIQTITQAIEGYQPCLSYKENFEDNVAMILEDGAFWANGEYVVPVHRILRFDAIPYEVPKKPVRKPATKSVNKVIKSTTKKSKSTTVEIKEGKVSKGGVNKFPVILPPPPPHGQG